MASRAMHFRQLVPNSPLAFLAITVGDLAALIHRGQQDPPTASPKTLPW